jgi:hypothetical protein
MTILASSDALQVAPSDLDGPFGNDSSQAEELSGSLGRTMHRGLFLIIWSPFYSCRSVPEIYGSDFPEEPKRPKIGPLFIYFLLA